MTEITVFITYRVFSFLVNHVYFYIYFFVKRHILHAMMGGIYFACN